MGLGEGYMPAIKEARPYYGVYGSDWRATPGLQGMAIVNMPMRTSMPLVNPGLGGLGSLGGFITDENIWQDIWMYVSSKVTKQDFDTIKKIFSGEREKELRAMKAEMNRVKSELLSAKGEAKTLEELASWEQAWAKYLRYEAEVLEAIAFYNQGIWKIRDMKAYADAAGIGFSVPDYMSGLGIAPIVIGGVAAAAIVQVIAMLVIAVVGAGLIQSMFRPSELKTLAALGDKELIKQYINNRPKTVVDTLVEGTTTTVKWVAIGGIAFLVFKMFMDSGGLKGIKEAFKK